jgi:O-methyltransferase involved in polyketide biosynthesis
LAERVTVLRHGLRNALIPITTVLGLQIGELLAGAVVTETVFAWPGVAMYLTREAVFGTLRSISKIAPHGSELVFDYCEPGAFGADAPERVRLVLHRVREYGEPMCSGLEPTTLGLELSHVALSVMEDLGPVEVQARFLNQSDAFRAAEYWHLARASVRGRDA